jgi:hypothetical protein
MLRKFVVTFVSAAALVFAVACGGDGNASGFSLSASIDGDKFVGGIVQAQLDSAFMTISAAGNTQVVTLRVAVPGGGSGTVALAASDTLSFAEVVQGDTQWSTQAGGSGTVTFTSVSLSQATGTFVFTAPVAAGSSTIGTKHVTSGVFRVQF